jgi:putative transposase
MIAILHEWDAGAKLVDLERRRSVTGADVVSLEDEYGGLQVNEAKRPRALEEENRLLKRLVADEALNLHVVKDLLGKRW